MPYAVHTETSYFAAISRGLKRRCPNCGEGRAFRGYLTLNDACPACGEALGHIRADDFPPYLTIFAVGHLVVPMALFAEQSWSWPVGLHMAVWLPMTLMLLLLLLPLMKGGAVGLMWRLGLAGDERQ
ncbi:MAG: DUF983 domain-containing protein [Alphaproteobacteria bacterium]